ncbi:CRISPR-associated endoribonuclease Cas6 [Thermococcus thioreducens]|uniref:CRISPR-associated endoribonuclease n=1 Tax=Thermococcus thioreducens TaxID=277988 RepID=A0A0Q2MP90_9EURY|nr:CRISPR-associated endoribonuclease Cas6 [Thermococcus thioreducens]ASJ13194.1 CRISPR-associated endoribonuclease Cas6 [Thermococcus thioreducens]KQH81511.1 CRISPR-associated protein Cas6 [Thermococcus thioreducens]SEW20797.1 CRISPR-associated protein, Cas6 family [Thermococcus thioreducens]
MRVEIKFRPAKEGTILPFNYNYDVYVQLLEKMAIVSPEIAHEAEVSHVDYFTFSRIMVRKRELIPDRGIRVLSDDVSLYVSSSSSELIKAVVEGFIDSPVLQLGDSAFIADDIKILKEPRIKEGALFSTLSPIMVRTVKLSGNRMKIWDLYPSEEAFFDKLRKVMLMRYSAIMGTMPEEKDFAIDVIKFKPVRILVRDTYYRGSLMIFRYHGSPEIARFGYENGFGEKTRYGFGMVKVIDEEPKREGQE